jgi:hypothetical protein
MYVNKPHLNIFLLDPTCRTYIRTRIKGVGQPCDRGRESIKMEKPKILEQL